MCTFPTVHPESDFMHSVLCPIVIGNNIKYTEPPSIKILPLTEEWPRTCCSKPKTKKFFPSLTISHQRLMAPTKARDAYKMSSVTPILDDFQQEYIHTIKSTLVLIGGRDALEHCTE